VGSLQNRFSVLHFSLNLRTQPSQVRSFRVSICWRCGGRLASKVRYSYCVEPLNRRRDRTRNGVSERSTRQEMVSAIFLYRADVAGDR